LVNFRIMMRTNGGMLL